MTWLTLKETIGELSRSVSPPPLPRVRGIEMTADELKALDEAIAAKRAAREKLALEVEQKRNAARILSEEIRQLEAKLPTPKERRGIRMSVEPATVAIAPKK